MTVCNIQIQPSRPGIYAVDMTGIVGVTAISTSQKSPGPFNSLIPPCQPLLMLIPASQQRQQMSQHPRSCGVTGACPRASPIPRERLHVVVDQVALPWHRLLQRTSHLQRGSGKIHFKWSGSTNAELQQPALCCIGNVNTPGFYSSGKKSI